MAEGIMGAFAWVIEIVLPSIASHDYVREYDLYRRTGVRKY